MRYLMLWAGQKMLYGLWFLAWPIVIWRWMARIPYGSPRERRHLRGSCFIGGIFWGGCVLTGVVNLDVSLVYHPLIFYIPWGIRAMHTVNELVRKHKPNS